LRIGAPNLHLFGVFEAKAIEYFLSCNIFRAS